MSQSPGEPDLPFAPAVEGILPPAKPGGQRAWFGRALVILEPISIAGFFVFLLQQTWLRWSDPLIDFPRDLYYAWRISEGDLLYERLVNWYGPLANLAEGAGFRIFGAGLDTIVWMNIGLTAGVLLLLRSIFGLIGNRLMVWLSSVVFLGIFAFGHYGPIGNYNFITPYVAQTAYSFAGLVLVLWGVLKHLKTDRSVWMGVAGLGLAIAYLDKPEALLAAAGALGLYFITQIMWVSRRGDSVGRWLLRVASWLAGGFLCLWLPVFIYFWSRGGLVFAFRATDYAVIFLLDSTVRDTAVNAPFMLASSGFDRPWRNFLFELWRGGEFALLCAGMAVAAWGWVLAPKFSLKWWLLLVTAVGAAAGCAWLSLRGGNLGAQLVVPVVLAAIGYAMRSLWLAWRGRAEFSRVLGVAVVGVAAALMMARMILNARIVHYGFFMMPLAMLFWIQLLGVEAANTGFGRSRRNWLLPFLVSALALICTGAWLHTSFGYYNLKTYAVGAGRDRFYSFPPEQYRLGKYLNTMIEAVKAQAPTAKTLAALPEGIALNYHLRVPTPLKELVFDPVALRFTGEQNIVAELQARPPEAILLFDRDFSEYGAAYFGADEASGRDIILWLKDRYKIVWLAGASKLNATGHALDLFVPVNTPDPSRPSLPPEAK